MEEEENLDMGLFGGNMELNNPLEFTLPNDEPVDDDETQVEELEKNNEPIEDENPEEVDGEEDEQNEGSDEGGESSSNLFSSIAALVHEQGFLPSLDIDNIKDLKSPEDLSTAFNSEIEARAKAMFEQHVQNLDTNQIVQNKKAIQELGELTEEHLKGDLDLAKKIIYDDYINQGLDEKKAARYLKRIIDLGEEAIIEESVDSLSSLKEFNSKQIELQKENAIKQAEQEKAAQVELDNKLKSTIYENTSLITGYKPTKAMRDKVYQSINEVVGKSPEGYLENRFMKERRESPIEFETRMYYFYELTNGFKDYSKLITSAKSNAVKDLEKIAKQTKIKDNGTPIWMQDNESYGGVGVELNL